MKSVTVVLGGLAFSISLLWGCSQESRDEALDRLTKAGKSLNGEVRPDDKDNGTPNIVSEQQRKERVRQNTQWTAENQRLHPIEYCQAQLEETSKMEQKLDVQQHKLLLSKSASARKLDDLKKQAKQLT